MIPVNELLTIFQQMNKEHWSYIWGKAEKGCVDCSGAFVYAYSQYGKSIYHGSNRIARKYVKELLPVSQAKPGMAAFKGRQPGETGYALPSSYANDADQTDWHHIGLVDEDTNYVLNAQSTQTGFQRSKITKGWDAVGYLIDVDYSAIESTTETKNEGSESTMALAYVKATSGDSVNLRKKCDVSSDRVAKVPVGTQVQAEDQGNGWAKVIYNGLTGYMKTEFLGSSAGSSTESTSSASIYTSDVQTALEKAQAVVDYLQGILNSKG